MVGFDNPWYAGIIERFAADTRDDETLNNSVDALSRSVVVAACVVAQALDGLAQAVRDAQQRPSAE